MSDEPYDVLTIHREANTEPDRLRRLIESLNATGRAFVFPVHPRTRKVLDDHGIEPAPQLRQLAPIGYLEMLALVAGARVVVTDSGGLQKEAYWLRVPCVTLRPSTEWVDTVLARANTLVDPDDPSRLPEVLERASFPPDAPQLYGNGHTAASIAEALYTLTRGRAVEHDRHRRGRLRRRAARARLRGRRRDGRAGRRPGRPRRTAEPRRELHRGRALGGAEGPRRRRARDCDDRLRRARGRRRDPRRPADAALGPA